jgi:hypothetical protein
MNETLKTSLAVAAVVSTAFIGVLIAAGSVESRIEKKPDHTVSVTTKHACID